MAGASLCGFHNLVVPEGVPEQNRVNLCVLFFLSLYLWFVYYFIDQSKPSHLANSISREWRSRLGILMGGEAKSYFIWRSMNKLVPITAAVYHKK